MSSSTNHHYHPSTLMIPSHRLAYTFLTPSYPPSAALHRSMLPYSPPSPGELSIEVHAASIQPVDIQMINFWLFNWFFGPGTKEKAVGQDYSGIVVETTPDTLASHPHLTVGTPVFGLHLTAGTGSSHGSLSTHLTLRPSSPASSAVVPLHTDISHVDAASLPLVWITAYTALVKYGLLDTQPGRGNERRTVVIVGASGGAGSYAVQVAKKLLGVGTVIGVCSSRNAKFVSEELGADVVLEYDQEPEGVAAGLRRLMPEGGYDVVFDCVGGTEVVNQYRQLCKRGGAGGFVTIVGDKSNRDTLGGAYTNLTNPFQLFRTFLGWLGLAPRYHCIDLIPSVASLEAILPLLIKPGGLTIPIDSVHAFTEEGVKAGFERLDSGRVKGKVVVKVKED